MPSCFLPSLEPSVTVYSIALGFLVGSMVNFALRKTLPSIVIVVSPFFAERRAPATICSGRAWPSRSPETIDHSPSSRARSFLATSEGPPPARNRPTRHTGSITRIGFLHDRDGTDAPLCRPAAENASSQCALTARPSAEPRYNGSVGMYRPRRDHHVSCAARGR